MNRHEHPVEMALRGTSSLGNSTFRPNFAVIDFHTRTSSEVEIHARTHAHVCVYTRGSTRDPCFPMHPFAFSADFFFIPTFFYTLTNLRNCGSRSDPAFFFAIKANGVGWRTIDDKATTQRQHFFSCEMTSACVDSTST